MEDVLKPINQYVTRKVAAKYLGVSRWTLLNWERQGMIRVYRNPINNYRLYDLEDLEALLVSLRISGDINKIKAES